MNITHVLSKELHLLLEAHGFERSKNIIYKIENEICFCIHIQKALGAIHVHYFILPLYMPNDYIVFTYGNRLNWVDRTLPDIPMSTTESEILNWCGIVYESLCRIALPFFENVSTPKKAASFAGQFRIIPQRYMGCCKMHRLQLALYSHAYLGNQVRAFITLLRYIFSQSWTSVTPDLRIPFEHGRFKATAMTQDEFKKKVLKIK